MLLTPSGDDKLRIVGKLTLPHPFSPVLDPLNTGVRVVIADTAGAPVVDATIPSGAALRSGPGPSSADR